MEDQAEYEVNKRQFHGDYLQGKRPGQYENSAICFGYAMEIFIGLCAIFAAYFIGRWVIQIFHALWKYKTLKSFIFILAIIFTGSWAATTAFFKWMKQQEKKSLTKAKLQYQKGIHYDSKRNSRQN